MDQRAAPQTRQILKKAKGNPALKVNCGGKGPLSAEWMIPKALWIYQNEPEVWQAAETICEYQDFVNAKLTGRMCASSCNAASRWHWDGEKCIENGHDGRPMSLYKKIGLSELADKLPSTCLPMGSIVGNLTSEAAEHLGLSEGIPVVQGGADAFVGMLGLGCIHPGQLCLITGSSHLHCVVTSKATTSKGIWGAYRGAPLPGINFAEGKIHCA
jgi:ribulose kinase